MRQVELFDYTRDQLPERSLFKCPNCLMPSPPATESAIATVRSNFLWWAKEVPTSEKEGCLMDPTTVATTAVTVLAPYIVKAGEKTAEKLGEMLPAGIGKVWTAITGRFKGKAAAESATAELVAQPDDEDNQTAFRIQLKKVLENDPGFMAELAQLLSIVQPERGDQILNTGSGAVATHGGIGAGAGGVAVGGDVHGGIVMEGRLKKE